MIENADELNVIRNQYLRLLKEQAKIDPEHRRLREHLDKIRNQIAGLELVLIAANVDINALQASVRPGSGAEVEKKSLKSYPDAIVQVLRTVGQAMHYKDITTRLLEDGCEIGGREPANTINAYITQNKRLFAKAPEKGRGYYKLKEWTM